MDDDDVMLDIPADRLRIFGMPQDEIDETTKRLFEKSKEALGEMDAEFLQQLFQSTEAELDYFRTTAGIQKQECKKLKVELQQAKSTINDLVEDRRRYLGEPPSCVLDGSFWGGFRFA